MKFQVYSDLHVEFGHSYVPQWDGESDYLLLAGDIHLGIKPSAYVKFLKACTAQGWKKVYFIAGNHEFYNGNYTLVMQDLPEFAKESGAVFLDNAAVNINDEVLLFGGTMWTDLSNPIAASMAGANMNDYQICKIGEPPEHLLPSHTTEMFYEFCGDLSIALDKNAGKLPVVVMTHTAPHALSGAREYKGAILNAAYYTDMTEYMDRDVNVWVHGHMHNASDYMVENTRVIANPYGYHGSSYNQEALGFKENGIGFTI